MKRAQFESYGGVEVLEIKEVPIPTLKRKQLLVKVEAAALNPKDVILRRGKFKILTGNTFPQSVGFDFAGTVADSNGHPFKAGDRVFGMIDGLHGRTCAEYVNVNLQEVHSMPDGLSFEEAAGIPLVGQTALQALRDLGRLQAGQSICINGASGGVGTMAIQIAKTLGGVVTAIASHRNESLCLSLGADYFVDYTQTQITESEHTFDLFFDVFGNYSFDETTHLLAPGGIYITTVPQLSFLKELGLNLFRKKKAKLVLVRPRSTDLQWLCDQLEQGILQPVTDRIFPLEDLQAAQRYIESKRARGKVIIKVG